jgi:hypothetical protein
MKNLKNLNVTPLSLEEQNVIIGGKTMTWSEIYDQAYSGNWESAVHGVGNKLEDFFE